MTRKEIIKALRCCNSDDGCRGCPLEMADLPQGTCVDKVLFAAADLLEQDAEKTSWISVKDRLPEREQHDYVLVCCTMNVTSTINYENAVTMAYVCEEGFMDVELNEVITRGVTHWMPLPEPPKEGLE